MVSPPTRPVIRIEDRMTVGSAALKRIKLFVLLTPYSVAGGTTSGGRIAREVSTVGAGPIAPTSVAAPVVRLTVYSSDTVTLLPAPARYPTPVPRSMSKPA